MKNKLEPCLEKNCSWCCDPVKVDRFFREDKIPINKKGEKIWQDNEEILIPEKDPDGPKLKTYRCINLDKETGLCKDYDDRPEICKDTSCIDEDSIEDTDKQHSKMINQKFISIPTK